MNFKINPIPPPARKEKTTLRLMILIGVLSMAFFLYNLFQKNVISSYPLYVLLMITMIYYCLKYLHEWYHYFSISVDLPPPPGMSYTVDVLTTYCAGEPFDMLEQTLIAIQNISYPHTAWCCDEADDPNVKKLCDRLGVKHITRTDKKDAKAGNINNALRFATGDLCIILDPDHVPAPEFIDVLVSCFDDPSVGFVQIVQAYYNQTESLVAKGAAQQTYQFYGPMMMSMNSYGTVQAIGANCTFRRAALDSIGGHASGLAEDMHTAMKLHAKGWRSLYIPVVLTRGLVPATMSSYYKQQLKWSRGTWELLLITYPKLFTKFTWRQKLHYFILPFHYLCGLIFFINFLIPVICLFTGAIPLQMDIFDFILATFPLFVMMTLIRHYAQKWVAEENERGFHVVGGILQIGAWWVHTVGFVYTIFRKKVPYIPTPKNDEDSLPFLLSLPNILVAVISLTAIIYGLLNDFSPYTVFMIALAGMQILFMAFNLSISGYTRRMRRLKTIARKVRNRSWIVIKVHGFLRSYSLALSTLLIISFSFAFWKKQQLSEFLPGPLAGLKIFYKGINTGYNATDKNTADSFFSNEVNKNKIAIISSQVPWGPGQSNNINTAYLTGIYKQHAIPLLIWTPYREDPAGNSKADSSVIQSILSGKYNASFLSFAKQIAALGKPVFLTLGTGQGKNRQVLFNYASYNPPDFIAAWRYVHTLLDSAGVENAIWVWNTPDASSVTDYFPGENYVDWLGVNISDTGKVPETNLFSFDTLYRPYHTLHLFKSGMPVMLMKIDGLQAKNQEWWNNAWQSIDTAFTEIKAALVEYNAVKDQPVASNARLNIKTVFAHAPDASLPVDVNTINWLKKSNAVVSRRFPFPIKGVIYDKGIPWFRNRYTLELSTIEADLKDMESIGINTIERTMPGVYDRGIGKVLMSDNMHLIPRFWFPAAPQAVADDNKMKEQEEKILRVIRENVHKNYVTAWDLGDDILYHLSLETYKPDYFFYEQKYIAWLSNLCRAIRKIDNTRPILMDLHWDAKGRSRFSYYKAHVPEIDIYMLVADKKYRKGLNEPLEKDMAWGQVPVALWSSLPSIAQSGIVPAWQDNETTNYVKLNGIIDLDGRKKDLFHVVSATWGHATHDSTEMPRVKILRSAEIAIPGEKIIYHLMHHEADSAWHIYTGDEKNTRFEWYLVKLDQYGNTMFIKRAGNQPYIELTIPDKPLYYELYVEVISGKYVTTSHSTLNTPLE